MNILCCNQNGSSRIYSNIETFKLTTYLNFLANAKKGSEHAGINSGSGDREHYCNSIFMRPKWTSSPLTSSGEDLNDSSHKIIEIFLKWKSGHVIRMRMYFCFW